MRGMGCWMYSLIVPGARRGLEQRLLPGSIRLGTLDTEMLIREMGRHSPARGAIEKANLNEERLGDFFDGVGLFGQRGCQLIQAHRAALVLLDDGQQQLAIDLVEAVAIDFEHL